MINTSISFRYVCKYNILETKYTCITIQIYSLTCIHKNLFYPPLKQKYKN